MLLCIDVGNTNIVLGCYNDDGTLAFSSRISTDSNRSSDQYAVELKDIISLYHVPPESIENTIISSVVPDLTNPLCRAAEIITGCTSMRVGPGIKTGLNIRIDDPAQLGSDFVIAAVAAKQKYPLPHIIIDMGTATTISAVTKNGDFVGASIMPGLRISVEALVARSSLLTRVSYDAPKYAIGTNSDDSMRSGIIFGGAAMIDGLCDRFMEELGEQATIIATGGLAPVVIPHCKHRIIFDDLLLLEGLRILYLKNCF